MQGMYAKREVSINESYSPKKCEKILSLVLLQ